MTLVNLNHLNMIQYFTALYDVNKKQQYFDLCTTILPFLVWLDDFKKVYQIGSCSFDN